MILWFESIGSLGGRWPYRNPWGWIHPQLLWPLRTDDFNWWCYAAVTITKWLRHHLALLSCQCTQTALSQPEPNTRPYIVQVTARSWKVSSEATERAKLSKSWSRSRSNNPKEPYRSEQDCTCEGKYRQRFDWIPGASDANSWKKFARVQSLYAC